MVVLLRRHFVVVTHVFKLISEPFRGVNLETLNWLVIGVPASLPELIVTETSATCSLAGGFVLQFPLKPVERDVRGCPRCLGVQVESVGVLVEHED